MKSRMNDYPTSLSMPIDRTAQRVISKGFSHEFERKEHSEEVWDTPPPVEPFPQDLRKWLNTRHDRLTLVGYLGKHKKQTSKHKFLVRCDCGLYAMRKWSSWVKKKDVYDDCCVRCKTIQQRIHHDTRRRYFEQHGVDMPDKKPRPKPASESQDSK